jgi:hypothetical protein
MADLGALPALQINPVGFGAENSLRATQARSALQDYQYNQQMNPLALAAKAQELKQAQALDPLLVTRQQQENTQSGQKSDLGAIEVNNQTLAQVAKAAQTADPEDAPNIWDEGMKAAAAKGVTQASQYIGHYRPDLAERVGDAYGAPQGADKAAAATQAGAMTPDVIDRAVSKLSPQDIAKSLGNMNRAIIGFNRIKDEASWNAEMVALKDAGMDPAQFLPNLDWNPLNYAAASRLIQKLAPMRDGLERATVRQTAGVPASAIPPAYEPQSQYIGIDQATGRPVYHDIHGQQPDTMGNTPIGPKPSAAMSTFMLKQNAWLQAHPGDSQGALEFANGKRSMDPAQMQAVALSEANKELGDITLAGTTIADPEAWVRTKAQQNYQLLTSAAAPVQKPAGPTIAIPARALDALRKAGGKPVKFNNGQSWKMGANGQPVRVQ